MQDNKYSQPVERQILNTHRTFWFNPVAISIAIRTKQIP